MSFGTCSILHYERVRNLYIKGSLERNWPTRRFPKLFGIRDAVCQIKCNLKYVIYFSFHLLFAVRQFIVMNVRVLFLKDGLDCFFFIKLNKWWNSLPEGRKTAVGIIFLNTAVFLLWRIPRMQYFMYKWFTTSPAAG